MGVSYHTLKREDIFKNPPKGEFPFPLLQEAVAPHIGSFNALMDSPDGGMLNLAVKDIGSKTVFDSSDTTRLGNKLTGTSYLNISLMHLLTLSSSCRRCSNRQAQFVRQRQVKYQQTDSSLGMP